MTKSNISRAGILILTNVFYVSDFLVYRPPPWTNSALINLNNGLQAYGLATSAFISNQRNIGPATYPDIPMLSETNSLRNGEREIYSHVL